MWLVEIALKIPSKKSGQKIPKLTMVKITGYDLTKNQKEELPIDEVDITLEEMEAPLPHCSECLHHHSQTQISQDSSGQCKTTRRCTKDC